MTTDCSMPRTASDPLNSSFSKHRLKPRFSLRFLLITVTVFAIAFPMWYVWPYTEREVHYVIDPRGKADKTKPPRGETITSMRRVIGGEPVRHGLRTTRIDESLYGGLLEESQEYVNGVAHGSYRRKHSDFESNGQYEHGEKTGEWAQAYGGYSIRQNWRKGKRHGMTRHEDSGREVLTLSYDEGVLTHRNGRPVSYPLLQQLARGELRSGTEFKALTESTQCEFHNYPLADVVEYFKDFHQTEIQVDPAVFAAVGSGDGPPITAKLFGTDLGTALCLIADDAGLECKLRNGIAWITMPESETDDATKK